MRSFFVVSGVV